MDTDDIIDAATSPAEVEGEAGRVKARSIDEMIRADQYAKEQAALASASSGSAWGRLRPARVVPPGAIGPTCS